MPSMLFHSIANGACGKGARSPLLSESSRNPCLCIHYAPTYNVHPDPRKTVCLRLFQYVLRKNLAPLQTHTNLSVQLDFKHGRTVSKKSTFSQ
jgi:hypothetical protein